MRGETWRILVGDVRQRLAELPAASVQCVVTSPPYWGLRDYGVPGQLGLEPTIEEYIANQVEVFRAVRRVLRDDGTLWLNMGDSYAAQRGGTAMPAETLAGGEGGFGPQESHRGRATAYQPHRDAAKMGLKHKDLIGQPWRLAFALQQDGWYLRADIIWHKPNPMPESVTDRPTKSHEFVFLLSKSARYVYDADAVREGLAETNAQRTTDDYDTSERGPRDGGNRGLNTLAAKMRAGNHAGRNLRTVWTIPTESFRGAHFATFPQKLVEPCIKAGTSERGRCPACGACWRRVVESKRVRTRPGQDSKVYDRSNGQPVVGDTAEKPWRDRAEIGNRDPGRHVSVRSTTGWQPGCTCPPADPVPCLVLDPYAGSGTTLLVAARLGRDAVGVELNPKYARIAERRIRRGLRPSTFVNDESDDVPPLFAGAQC